MNNFVFVPLFRLLLLYLCRVFSNNTFAVKFFELIVSFWQEMQLTVIDFSHYLRTNFVIGRAKLFAHVFFLYLASIWEQILCQRTNKTWRTVIVCHKNRQGAYWTLCEKIAHVENQSESNILISKILSDNSITAADMTRGDNKRPCSLHVMLAWQLIIFGSLKLKQTTCRKKLTHMMFVSRSYKFLPCSCKQRSLRSS